MEDRRGSRGHFAMSGPAVSQTGEHMLFEETPTSSSHPGTGPSTPLGSRRPSSVTGPRAGSSTSAADGDGAAHDSICDRCGNHFWPDSVYCRKCGAMRGAADAAGGVAAVVVPQPSEDRDEAAGRAAEDDDSGDEVDRVAAACKLRLGQEVAPEANAAVAASSTTASRALPSASSSRNACNDTTMTSFAFDEDDDPLANLGFGDSADEDSDGDAIVDEIDEELLEDSEDEHGAVEASSAAAGHPAATASDEVEGASPVITGSSALADRMNARVDAFSTSPRVAEVSSEDEIELEVLAESARPSGRHTAVGQTASGATVPSATETTTGGMHDSSAEESEDEMEETSMTDEDM